MLTFQRLNEFEIYIFERVHDSLTSEVFDLDLSRSSAACLLAMSVLLWLAAFTVRGAAYDLKAGDRLYLPAGTRHGARVLGRETVLSLDGTRR